MHTLDKNKGKGEQKITVEFRKISDFARRILYLLLKEAYSYDERIEKHWGHVWEEFDNFFFDNLNIADTCGFITTIGSMPIGFASWDPRNTPIEVIVGHNCIVQRYKNKGYGKIQLQEAIQRMKKTNCAKIIVTTNQALLPAQKMYENLGFIERNRRMNSSSATFMGDYINYEIIL
ncbi:GNAT family N-acetyltransferase [Candidatus Enterococcus clewellii]|uniref:N-acetyltransferase domain-containing protein n=1 Tax=Candidatus Enterococcus clewellii TaxID=1834193 RepID=A0A242K954_9ENTE|nr:GNAT family N-acetyltransferase [Enterococcus sp. 9E7_DIV0242]OTP17693.1 hypothetical protein A5888_001831 [Enterococcus sp. 9E7_DIV0242]